MAMCSHVFCAGMYNAASKTKMTTVDCAECGEYFMKNTMTRHTDGTFFCSPCWKTMEAYLGNRLVENNKDLEEDLAAANQRIEELKSQVANLANRNEQLTVFLETTYKVSLPVINLAPQLAPSSFAGVVKQDKHSMGMDPKGLEAYTQGLQRAYAMGNLKPPGSPGQCPSCGSPEICTCY